MEAMCVTGVQHDRHTWPVLPGIDGKEEILNIRITPDILSWIVSLTIHIHIKPINVNLSGNRVFADVTELRQGGP